MKKLIAISNFIYFVFVFPSTNLMPYSKIVSNALNEIEIREGRIKLDLIKVWGDEKIGKANEIFRIPRDIKIYKDYIYIVDSGNNRIQIFSLDGEFKTTIGRKGQGPGDLSHPSSLVIDNENRLLVADSGNNRVQTLDSSGNYIFSFPTKKGMPSHLFLINQDEIAVYSFQRSFKSNFLLTLYNRKGQFLKEIGEHLFYSSKKTISESVSICLDNSSNVYYAYSATPLIKKTDKTGNALLSVVFETAYKTPLVEVKKSSNSLIVKGKKENIISSAISVDDKGNIFLVTTTRPEKKNERVYLVGNKASVSGVAQPGGNSEETDRFMLLVFNKMGKIIATCKLNIYCDSIYAYKNRIYIIDSFRGMKIYEYKFSLI
jgi:hypothetical protein